MTKRKNERLINLMITLLVSQHYLTKKRIHQIVKNYHNQTDKTFEQMFERNKKKLHKIKIDIEMNSFEKTFENELNYRIQRDTFELPKIPLKTDEATIINLAAHV